MITVMVFLLIPRVLIGSFHGFIGVKREGTGFYCVKQELKTGLDLDIEERD